MAAVQNITLIVKFESKTNIWFETSLKSCLQKNSTLITPKSDLCKFIQCNQCEQRIKINLFWSENTNFKEFEAESAQNSEEKHLETENVPLSAAKRQEIFKPITKTALFSKQTLYRHKWGTSDEIITNFNLQLNVCDICGKTKGKRSYFDFLKHRSTHFTGRKPSGSDMPFYCLGCDDKFLELKEIEMHSRTCLNRLGLIEQFKGKQNDDSSCKIYIPENIILPDLTQIKDTHYQIIPQPDGTAAYIERVARHTNIRVTNFDPKVLTCDLCNSVAKDLKHLISHRKLHFFQMTTDQICLGCKQKFPDPEDKVGHSYFCKLKDTININACSKCDYVAPKYKTLRHHIGSKHGPNKDSYKPYVMCHFCSKVIKKDLFEIHLRCHRTQDGKAFECAHCSKRFSSTSGIKDHLYKTHFKALAKHKCHLCPSVFYTEYEFRKHLNCKHQLQGSTATICKLCKKIMKNSESLQAHMRHSHMNSTEKQKHLCQICSKTFFSKYSLNKHAYQHVEENQRPFKCKFCERGFANKQQFIQHELSHTNNRQLFYCNTCGKAVKSKQSLQTHIRSHTGEMPYECQVCTKKFSDRGNFRQHLKQHEKELRIKLTYTAEERRLIKLRLMQPLKLIQKQTPEHTFNKI